MSNFVQYNGVMLGFVRTKAFAQEPVQLGPDYAAQRYLATWEVQGARLTVGQTGAGEPPGVAPVDTSGVRAFTQLHDRLLTPRQALRVRVGGVDVVNITAGSDVELGPKPLKFVVTSFQGEQGFTAEYTVQYTLPNPCPARNGVMAILGHVWKAEDDIDREFFLTRTYTGVIHLDPRVAGVRGAVHPDTIRHLYLPPRTPQLHRVGVQVRTLDDGYTVAYRVVDRQPTAFVNSAEVVRMEADHHVVHRTPGEAKRALGAVARAQPYIDAITIGGQIALGLPGILTAWASAQAIGAKAIGGLAQSAVETTKLLGGVFKKLEYSLIAAQYEGIPVVTHTITATAYGHPDSQYASLATAARVVALFRLMNSGVLRTQGAWSDFDGTFEEHDRSDPKSVRVIIEVSARPRNLQDEQRGQAEAFWNAAHAMPRLQGNRLLPGEIRAPNNAPVGETIRQLVFGGSVLSDRQARTLWGWVDSAFAPELMSSVDATSIGPQDAALTRPDARMARGVDPSSGIALFRGAAPVPGGPLQAQLLAAIQNLCDYKRTAAFPDTENRRALP